MNFALIAFFLAQILDVVTTLRALNKGAREANPIIKFFMDKFGKGWIAIKLALAGLIAYFSYEYGAVEAIWAVTIITTLVAVNNIRVGNKYK